MKGPDLRGRDLSVLYQTCAAGVKRIFRRGFLSRARRRVPGIHPPDEIPDLVQEVFARLASASSRIRPRTPEDSRPYVYQIARNLLLDWHLCRERSRRALAGLKDLAHSEERRARLEEPSLDLQERLARLSDFEISLPAEMQRFYDLRYVRGCSLLRTAGLLDLSRQSARTIDMKLTELIRQALK